MAAGVNYPISSDPNDITDTMGRWRMEVAPGSDRTADVFLHLIQVGDPSLAAMSTNQATDDESHAEVTFEAGSRTVTLRFAKTRTVGGHITIVDGAQTLADRDLTTAVQNGPFAAGSGRCTAGGRRVRSLQRTDGRVS